MDLYLSQNLPFILEVAPHGFFKGCGGTSEFITYILKHKPNGERDIFEVLRTHKYYNSFSDKKEFNLNQVDELLSEIDKRLSESGYVTVSFFNDKEIDEVSIPSTNFMDSIKDLIFNGKKYKCILFDHSFVLTKLNNDYIRLESYIFNYEPRQIIWNTYKKDLTKLLSGKNRFDSWKQIFGVECNINSVPDNVKIEISN